MIKEITSKKNQIIIDTISLRDNKISKQKKLFIIEGKHLLEMALKSNKVKYILTNSKLKISDDIPQYLVTNEILEKVSCQKSFPNVIAVCSYLETSNVFGKKLLYLDNIQDPGNLGTILRSALAFSYYDIIVSSGCANIYNEKTIQASQGAIFDLNISSGDLNILKELQKNDYEIIATSLDKDSVKLSKLTNIKDKVVFVFGNEGNGVTKEIIDLADKKLFIEMDNIDSLNVAIAASIILYKFH